MGLSSALAGHFPRGRRRLARAPRRPKYLRMRRFIVALAIVLVVVAVLAFVRV